MIARRRWLALSMCVLVWLACPRTAAAATCTWTGAGLTPLWSNASNWDNCDGQHPIPQNGDTLLFFQGGAQPGTFNDIAGLAVLGIVVEARPAGGQYVINGVPLTITSFLDFHGDAAGTGPMVLTPITLGGFMVIRHFGSGATALVNEIAMGSHGLEVSTFGAPILVAGTISGTTGTLEKRGNFDLQLAGPNTYEGTTIVHDGGVALYHANALGAALMHVSSRHTIIERSAYVTIDQGLTIAESFLTQDGFSTDAYPTLRVPVGQVTLSGVFATTTAQTIFDAVDNSATINVTGPIAFGSGVELVKRGAGVVVVSHGGNGGHSTYIEAGVLRLGASNVAMPDGTLLTIEQAGAFDLNGHTETIGSIRANGPIMLGSGTLTITQNLPGWLDGVISGSGNLVKSGPFTLPMAGGASNTYTGSTTVTQGMLVLTKFNATAIRGNVLVNGGTLAWNLPHQIDDGATITVGGSSVLEVGPYQEAIAVLTGTGSVSIDDLGRLAVGGTHASMLFAGSIGGSGRFRKEGNGVLTLAGSHSLSGVVEVAAGTLLVNGNLPTARLTGGVLGGSGNVAAIESSAFGGAVSPGASPGILGAGTASLGAGTLFVVELNGSTPGTGHDRLATTGAVTLAGATLSATLGYVPAPGTTFTIVSVGSGAVTGAFAGLPQNSGLMIGGRPFRISYTGGDGNDVVLTALATPEISIDDVTIVEGDSGSTNAVFTVSLSSAPVDNVSVQYTTVDGTAASPHDYAAQSGTVTFAPGSSSQTVTVAVHGDTAAEPAETFLVRLSDVQGDATLADAEGLATITDDDAPTTPTTLTWYLAEGATGGFFDNDVLIANPTTTSAPVTLTFFPEGGSPIVDQRTIPAQSRVTIHVDQLPGLENVSAAVQVTSTDNVPLVVERTMFWDATYYGGHTGAAVTQASTTWFFAEASQGFFDTYVLITNANTSAADVTLTFLREGEPPVVKTVPVGAASRLTIPTSTFSELIDRSFGLSVEATQPLIAERSMYFGSTPTRLWSGGHESPGVTQTATRWFHAEGATGGFFDTYILLSNPSDAEAHVTLDFLTEDGGTVRVPRTVPAKGRITVDVEAQDDPRLRAGAVSTVVTSDRPIVSERSTYWAGGATPWGEGHNSFGLTETSPTWGLAEGRVGGDHHFVTFILLANPQPTAANVTVTYLRETGAPIVKTYTLLPESRFTIGVNSDVPELHDEAFGARIEVTNGVPIAVERSMYWDAIGVFWAGGSHAPATRLP